MKTLCSKGCGHMASNGQHAKGSCPPSAGIHGEHRKDVKRRKRHAGRTEHVVRGVVVPGTGVPKGT